MNNRISPKFIRAISKVSVRVIDTDEPMFPLDFKGDHAAWGVIGAMGLALVVNFIYFIQ